MATNSIRCSEATRIHALQVAKLAGAASIHLTVNSHAQDSPLSFFKEKCGFEEQTHWDAGNGTTEHLLSKSLESDQPVPVKSAAAHADKSNARQSSTADNAGRATAAGSDSRSRKRARDDEDHWQPVAPAQRRRTTGDHHSITLKAPYIRSASA